MFLFIRTMFLTGPMNQLKKMFDPSRLVATIVFLVKFIRNNWAKKKKKTPGLDLFGYDTRIGYCGKISQRKEWWIWTFICL